MCALSLTVLLFGSTRVGQSLVAKPIVNATGNSPSGANVLVSGGFFGGPPGRIIEAWQEDRLALLVSPAV